jgi:intein/homing endonuclease
MEKKSISEFLSDEYKEFAMYTIENRAIPSVIDGFKTSQRKIIHVSNDIWKSGNEKTLKVFQLAGKVASDAFYHHGNCLDGDTEILISNGSYITFKEWLGLYPNDKFYVTSYDEENKTFVKGLAHSPRVGKITSTEYLIETEDGEIHRCTDNQPYLTQRGWVQAKDLREDDEIISKPKH